MTQGELAAAIGIGQSVVSQYETGSTGPTISVLVRLAKALRISADVLVGLRPVKNLSELRLRDFRLMRRIEKVRDLPRRKREMVFELIETCSREQAMAKSAGKHRGSRGAE